jgi:hypothetical protein
MSASNQEWTPGNEITFDGTTGWSSCGCPPGFLGTLEFYVR